MLVLVPPARHSARTVAQASTETPGDNRYVRRDQHLTITEVFFGARRCGNVRFCNAKNPGPSPICKHSVRKLRSGVKSLERLRKKILTFVNPLLSARVEHMHDYRRGGSQRREPKTIP